MQWKNLLILSKRGHHLSKISSMQSSISRYATIPNRPMRGERGGRIDNNRRRAEETKSRKYDERDDLFLRNLNFGDSPKDDDEIMKKMNEKEDLFAKLDSEEPSKPKTQIETPKVFKKIKDAPAAVEDSDEIFKKMKETGLVPNAVAMLDGLCKDGLIQEAMKLFGTMREKGTIPEVVIYTAVVDGFCRSAKYDDAVRIFRKMQRNEILPNAFSYSVLVKGLTKGEKLEEAMEFCKEMLDAGHRPNAATLAGLVDGLCKEKGVEEAEGFVRSLKEKGFVVDEKLVREHLDKKGPYLPVVWEAIFGKEGRKSF